MRGLENGKLPVSYSDLREIGLHNDKARRAILVAIELGFVVKAPQLAPLRDKRDIRAPNLYGLTWFSEVVRTKYARSEFFSS